VLDTAAETAADARLLTPALRRRRPSFTERQEAYVIATYAVKDDRLLGQRSDLRRSYDVRSGF